MAKLSPGLDGVEIEHAGIRVRHREAAPQQSGQAFLEFRERQVQAPRRLLGRNVTGVHPEPDGGRPGAHAATLTAVNSARPPRRSRSRRFDPRLRMEAALRCKLLVRQRAADITNLARFKMSGGKSYFCGCPKAAIPETARSPRCFPRSRSDKQERCAHCVSPEGWQRGKLGR